MHCALTLKKLNPVFIYFYRTKTNIFLKFRKSPLILTHLEKLSSTREENNIYLHQKIIKNWSKKNIKNRYLVVRDVGDRRGVNIIIRTLQSTSKSVFKDVIVKCSFLQDTKNEFLYTVQIKFSHKDDVNLCSRRWRI